MPDKDSDDKDLTQLAVQLSVLADEVRRHRDTLYGNGGKNGLVSSVAVLRRLLEIAAAIILAAVSAVIGKMVL